MVQCARDQVFIALFTFLNLTEHQAALSSDSFQYTQPKSTSNFSADCITYDVYALAIALDFSCPIRSAVSLFGPECCTTFVLSCSGTISVHFRCSY
jgi:hypothetical protein